MLEKRERFFIRHRLVLRPKRGNGAALPLVAEAPAISAVAVLQAAVAAKGAFFKVGKNDDDAGKVDTVRITRVVDRPDDGMVVVLYRRRNPNASTQVFEDEESEDIRPAERGPKDDPAVSAHLFIQRDPHVGGLASHRAIMEEVPGLGSSYMKLLLDEVIRSREYDFKDDRGQGGKTSTKVDLFGVPSKNLRDAISKNGFDFIELVKAPDLTGLDTEGLSVRPERLRLYPRRGERTPGGETLLDRVFGWAKDRGWTDVSVQVSENNKSKVVKIGREADAATTLFVRADQITVADDLPSCSDSINEQLVAEAVKMFADDSSWE